MLRATLLIIGGVMLVAATFGALACWRLSAVIPLAVWGAVLAGGVMVERWRYRPLSDHPPGDDWQATRERFVDAESSRPVTVFFNPATGERRYVADDRRPLAARSLPEAPGHASTPTLQAYPPDGTYRQPLAPAKSKTASTSLSG